MAEAFVGTWNLKTSDKFDEYMKELGKCVFSVCSMCMGMCVCAHACVTGEDAVLPILHVSTCSNVAEER